MYMCFKKSEKILLQYIVHLNTFLKKSSADVYFKSTFIRQGPVLLVSTISNSQVFLLKKCK